MIRPIDSAHRIATGDLAGLSRRRISSISRAQYPQIDLESLYRVHESVRVTGFWPAFTKRAIDIGGAVVGLIVFSPVMLIAAILIKLSDGGPVFFRQTRVGRNGCLFSILKFRSMVVNADSLQAELMQQNQHRDNRTFKILNDPRMTRVGRALRRLSVDELPQFWNVIQGHMSLVGPRPALPSEVVLYERRDFARLSVKPGITCIWQVSGRSNLNFQDQLRLDLEYIQRQSLWLDIKLLLMTLPVVARGDGAA
jgi:lipopolysaccharide/colanic/teichoic acid biosynthesis glycosyltransferase